jgi:hypothetical protein
MGPLVCLSEATSPFGFHLARTGQVGEGVSPTLDDRVMCHERGLFARTKLGHLRFLRPDDMGLVGAVRSAHRGEARRSRCNKSQLSAVSIGVL